MQTLEAELTVFTPIGAVVEHRDAMAVTLGRNVIVFEQPLVVPPGATLVVSAGDQPDWNLTMPEGAVLVELSISVVTPLPWGGSF